MLLRLTGFILFSKSEEEFLASPKDKPSEGFGGSTLDRDGAGDDFFANGLKTFFLSFLPKRPLGLVSMADPLVSGLRLELLD